jgi:hypothetical protein
MPRAKANKLYRTFTKGMITEAGYLTYPEDASTDELNTIISRKGNRTRRRGIDFQDDYVMNSINVSDDFIVSEHSWLSVNNDASVAFVCVQVGNIIHFFNMNSEDPLSGSKLPFVIDLDSYKIGTANLLDLRRIPVEFASGFGLLYIAHPLIDPLSVEFKPLTNSLEIIRIVIQIRDLEGVYDGLANDEEPNQLTKEHQYNLQNQGWLPPGTKTVTPSLGDNTTTNPGGGGTGGSDGTYYDPYTGEERPSTSGGGSGFEFPNQQV